MIHLRSIELKEGAKQLDSFPFSLRLIKEFSRIEFRSSMTFFVGENGSGKSTLIEAIAAGANSISIGGGDIQRDSSLVHARQLARQMRFAWAKKTHRGFFLRAEDFFNFVKRTSESIKELDELSSDYDQNLKGYGRLLARNSALAQKNALVNKYGEDVDANSHGESFLKIFQARFVPGGLYLLDEPEAPLSPQRQLALLYVLHDMVKQNSQFIIATHSPILMAFPGASLLSFDTFPLREVEYDSLEHVSLTRDFLNNPRVFLQHLLTSETAWE